MIFHVRRILKDALVQFQLMEDVVSAPDKDTVESIVDKSERYQKDSSVFQFDELKAKREKELLKIRKEEEGRRRRYEERMMRCEWCMVCGVWHYDGVFI
ncbi:hypothetical protein EON63_20540 [archaeon]|nr:MAG: hypothetical protein EON63_20540 [archaeon]